MDCADPLAELTGWIEDLGYPSLSPTAVATTRQCFMDLIGVALAGTARQSCALTAAWVRANLGSGPARVWGRDQTASAPAAAWLNAMAGHALDWDDTCWAGVSHPSAALVPSILAVAQIKPLNGRRAIEAFTAGWETAARLGLALPHLFTLGWSTTFLLSGPMSAAASAKALGLSAARTGHAIGLALTQAGGARANNGTPAKPYGLGRAVEAGVTAALLAEQGLEASPDILTGPEGLFKVYGGDKARPQACQGAARPLVEEYPPWFKPWPSCSSTHPAMEALARLKAEHGLTPDQTRAVTCRVAPSIPMFLIYDRPTDSTQAQFSLPYCLAAILTGGDFGLADLDPARLADPDIKAAMELISYAPVEAWPEHRADPARYPEGAEVRVETKDGRSLTCFVGGAKGAPDNPLSPAEMEAKFRTAAATALSEAKIDQVLDMLNHLDTLPDISRLAEALKGE